MTTQRRIDKSKLPSRHVTVGPERAPHRSYLYAMGLTEEEIDAAVRRRRHLLERGGALQHRAGAPGAGGQGGRQGGGGTPREFTTITVTDGIAMGHAGHEVVAGQPRGDRRLRRAHHARPLLRRAGRHRRLRQVAAGHDDGDGAAQRAVGLHLWRLDPARPVQGQGRDRGGRVRGGGRALRRAACRTRICTSSNAWPAPAAGSCGGQFTANTMACVSEAIGLALPGSAGAPAPYEIARRAMPSAAARR